MITRSDSRARGLDPRRLLRPGGPLHPSEFSRSVRVATLGEPGSGPGQEPDQDTDGLRVRLRLRGDTVLWSDLMYPGADSGAVEEVRFGLAQYLGELQRAYGASGRRRTGVSPSRP